MSTYIVDALMIGRMPHSALSIAASSLGTTIYYGIVFFAIYMLNGLETIVAQAAGRGDRTECVRIVMQAMWIVLLGTPFVVGVVLGALALLPHLGVALDLTRETARFTHALLWSTLPLMLYMAVRRFLQSINRVALISVSLLTAGAVNWLFDWLLIFGHGHIGPWHVPAFGLPGSGWATVVVRCWMLMVLLPGAYLACRSLDTWPEWRMLVPDATRLKALIGIGWPSGLEFSLELGVSTVLSVLCARLGTTLLAAHQVTLDLNAFVYMVPTGLSYATMIHVGQAAGRNDLPWVRRAVHASMLLAMSYSTIAGLVFITFSHRLAGVYSNDPHVVSAAVPLFWLCSILILGDTVSVLLESAFTGLGDTRTPLWAAIASNWVIGMPISWLLAFPLGLNVFGLWIGRALASVASALILVVLWRRRIRAEKCSKVSLALPMLTPLNAL